MKNNKKKTLISGCTLIVMFILWTGLIQTFDVQAIGPKGSNIGFATFNRWFHQLTGVNMTLYTITDWLGLVPLFICIIFASIGLIQLITRKSLFKVDYDILILGVYYSVIIFCYIIFEIIPINYRPILINGMLETSYPSSTTLLVMGVMPTLLEQSNRRLKSNRIKYIIQISVIVFSAFMIFARLICGVHWFTDIIGSLLLCAGLYNLYKAIILHYQKQDRR